MDKTAKIRARVAELEAEGRTLDPQMAVQIPICQSWAVAAKHAIELASGYSGSYVKSAGEYAASINDSLTRYYSVRALTDLLRRVLKEIDDGLLGSFEDSVRADTFDDILEHAEAYLTEDRKDPAAVLAGVVFEDTIRRIALKVALPDPNSGLEQLINALQAERIMVKVQAQRCKASAALRNSATHARWTEFDRAAVTSTITLTRELLSLHLT